MALLGLFVAARLTERNFSPARERRWSTSLSIFRRGGAMSASWVDRDDTVVTRSSEFTSCSFARR
jgi:hypothetical protein